MTLGFLLASFKSCASDGFLDRSLSESASSFPSAYFRFPVDGAGDLDGADAILEESYESWLSMVRVGVP